MTLAVLASGIYTKPVLANSTEATLEVFLPEANAEESSSSFYLGDLAIEEDEVPIEEKMLEIKKEQEEKEKKEREEAEARIEARKRLLVQQSAKNRARAEAEAKARAEAEAKAAAEAAEKARQEAQRAEFAHIAHEEFLLAQILQHECGDNLEDQICAGSVVLNRVRTNYIDFRYVNTIAEVLYQPGQYYSGTKKYIEPGENALNVAHGLLSGEIPCYDEKILFQTTYWESWMNGELGYAELPGARQCYAYPLDYEEGCNK